MSKKSHGSQLSADSISALCYQLALMQKAGISSEESVSLLLADIDDTRLKAALNEACTSLSDGAVLSFALSKTGAFPDYMIRMLEIGQASGRLEQVLSALSEYYRKEAETQSAVRKAVAYPMGMAFLIAVVFLVLISKVLPVFERVFSQLGIALSPLARSLMTVGSASKYISIVLSVLLVLCSLLALYIFKTESGTRLGARLTAHFTSRSKMMLCVFRSRFTSAMSLMLSSGLHIDEAIDRTELLLRDSGYAGLIAKCRTLTAEGSSFASSVEQSGILSGVQAGLLHSGFRVGLPEEAMSELSTRCQSEADTLLTSMLSRFEFGMVVILCLSVGLVLLSVMLPLLGVLSGIGM